MTLLFISEKGYLLGLAKRCADEGYKVYLYVENKEGAFVGNGIVPKSSYLLSLLNKGGDAISSHINALLDETHPDLVILDSSRLGKVFDYITQKNIPCFGSNHWSDILSTSSSYFSSLSHAVGWNQWKGDSGQQVGCGFWWNGLQLISPFLFSNRTSFLTGDLGGRVESSGCCISPIFSSSILNSAIDKSTTLLKKTKFRGLFHLNCVVSKGHVFVASISSSLFSLPSNLERYKGSVVDLLHSVATGTKMAGEFTTDCALSILLSIPPFPSALVSDKDSALKGVSPSNLKHLYLVDVRKEDSSYVCANSSGELGYVCARGRYVNEAKDRAYKTLSNLSVEEGQYRLDIGEKSERWCNFKN